MESKDIHHLNDTQDISNITPMLWIQHEAKATRQLPSMTKLKQGHLWKEDENKWFFIPGRNLDMSKKIPIENFDDNINTYIQKQQIQKDWISVNNAAKKVGLAKIMKYVA